jgi:DNA-binding XRE family transcriptional regulator
MVNSEAFIARMEKMLQHYDLTASAFADKIGVQRSGISHLLSGRNKPSLEFVMKVIQTFPEVNLHWLLNGRGSFPSPGGSKPPAPEKSGYSAQDDKVNTEREIAKIVIFYKDGSFDNYDPS